MMVQEPPLWGIFPVYVDDRIPDGVLGLVSPGPLNDGEPLTEGQFHKTMAKLVNLRP